MGEKCSVCGNEIRLKGTKIKDGSICPACRVKLPINVYANRMEYTAAQIGEMFRIEESKPDINLFTGVFNRDKKRDKYDEVRELKKLLDDGIISQEEFESKKRELLELRWRTSDRLRGSSRRRMRTSDAVSDRDAPFFSSPDMVGGTI